MSNYLPKKVLLGFEDVFGQTPAVPAPYQLCVKTNGLVTSNDTEVADCIGGSIDSGGEKVVIGNTHNGDLESTAYWEQVGVYLKAILGSPTTVDNLNGTYTHTYDSTADALPSMYVENTVIGDTTFVEVFNGVLGNTFNTMFKGKGIPEVKLGMLASTHKDSLKDAYSALNDTGKVVLGSTTMNMTFTYINIDAAGYTKLSEFDLTIDRGTEAEDLVGNTKDVGIMKSDVTGNLKSVFDASLYTKIANNQKVAVEIGYSQTIGADAHSLAFHMGEVQFDFKTQPKVVGQKVSIDAPFSASRSSALTEKLKVVLKNTVASY